MWALFLWAGLYWGQLSRDDMDKSRHLVTTPTELGNPLVRHTNGGDKHPARETVDVSEPISALLREERTMRYDGKKWPQFFLFFFTREHSRQSRDMNEAIIRRTHENKKT